MPDGPACRFQIQGNRQGIKRFGFEFGRQAAGSHEIWLNPKTQRHTTVPNHPGDMPEGTLRAILKQAGIEPEDFLKG